MALEILSVLLPLGAVLCFGWGSWQCARRTLFPRFRPRGQETGGTGRAALLCLLVGAGVQGAFVLWCLCRYPGTPLLQALQQQFYGNTDARHYIDLALYGYGSGELFPEQYLMIVFFPLFPWLLRLLNPFGWLDWGILALAVQPPLFAAAGAGLFALVRDRFGKATAWRTLALLLVSPASVFFWSPMTESLFLALSVWYVFCLERDRWGGAALLGMLAGLTRAPGGLLPGLAVLYLVQRCRGGRRPPWFAWGAALAPALGLGGYFALNQWVYGRWDQYAVYQKEHWDQGMGLFTETIRYHLRYLFSWWDSDRTAAVWVCLTAVVCILLAFALLAAAARCLPASWLGYGLAYLAVTMGATWLLSAPRYAVALFSLPAALALLLQGHPRLTRCTWAVLLGFNLAYTGAYLTHSAIY